MNHLRIWAPRAHRVFLEIDGRCEAMTDIGEGWFEAKANAPQSDQRYTLRLDDGAAFPDPRSEFQPDGVHGASQRVDHGAFPWNDQTWQQKPLGPQSIIYELHVGTFCEAGTFDGAAEHLEHLISLGVTHVEVMPVAASPGERGWGYDGVSLYAPHAQYGGPAGFKRFVDACHREGLAVILDVVYNHLGPSGNYLGTYGPYFTNKYSTPWGEAINFDGPDSDEVRRFFIDNALMWLRDYHIDGLRLDAVHAIIDTSAVHFLEQLADEVRQLEGVLNRRFLLIAESDLNDPRLIRDCASGGYGLDAMWVDDFHHALHSVLTSERDGYYEDFGTLSHLAKALASGVVYDGIRSPHRRRVHGRAFAGVAARHLVVSLQNHDQVGNRAQGDRIGHGITESRLKAGVALLLTSPFVPLLFQGEEWGSASPFCYFTDHQEPELAAAVRNGRRREFAAFGWSPEQIPDPQTIDTFIRSKLDWNECARPLHADMLSWYKELAALRRKAAVNGKDPDKSIVSFDEQANWLTVRRSNLLVACNLSDTMCRVPCNEDISGIHMLTSKPGVQCSGQSLDLPPDTTAVLSGLPIVG